MNLPRGPFKGPLRRKQTCRMFVKNKCLPRSGQPQARTIAIIQEQEPERSENPGPCSKSVENFETATADH